VEGRTKEEGDHELRTGAKRSQGFEHASQTRSNKGTKRFKKEKEKDEPFSQLRKTSGRTRYELDVELTFQ
jgi:hypothetical protein